MIVSHIVAATRNNVIGNAGSIPWRLSSDLKHFSNLTKGHDVIMGRKTFESILEALGKPLPERRTIIVTRNTEYEAPDGCRIVSSIDQALENAEGEEVFIAGGAEIYRQSLARADRIYLTRIDADVAGDTLYPELDEKEWKLMSEERHEADEKNEYPFSFLQYERI